MTEEIASSRRHKLRDNFLAGDAATITDEALMEILLNYAIPRGELQPLAQNLLQKFGNLDGVLAANFDDLCRIKGIKSYTATLLKLVDHFHRPRVSEVLMANAAVKMPGIC